MSSRRALTCVPLALGAAVALAACGPASSGSSDSASAAGEGSSSSSSSSSASTSSAAPATPTDAAGLGALMRSGVAKLKTAHLDMQIDAAGTSVTASGDEKLADGKLQAMDLSEQIGSAGSLRLVIVDGKTYAQLPQSAGSSGKPWVLVTTDSTNPVVAQMASSLASVQQQASLDQFALFAQAASDVQPKGAEEVGGTQVTHYTISVDVTKMPDTMQGKDQLVSAGVTSIPVDLWVDGTGRPVKVTEQLSVQGQTVSTVVTLSKFDQPVTISAPPADQVGTD